MIEGGEVLIVGWMRGALEAVVTIVTLTPRPAIFVARSTSGIMWPGDRHGKKKMWRLEELVILAGASALNESKQRVEINEEWRVETLCIAA